MITARKFGLDFVGDISWGTHLCQFYETKHDLIDILVPYFAEGLRSNEACMWVTSEPLDVEEATASLAKVVPNVDQCIKNGQLLIFPYNDWYLKGGTFDADRVLQGWVEKEQEALSRGFEGLRLTGNTFWIERSLWDTFTDYEETVNNVIGAHRMIAVCTYSLEKCSGSDVTDVIRNHSGTIIKKGAAWVVVEDVVRRKEAEVALLQDITERKNTEQDLWKVKNDWECTFDSIPDFIAILDTKHRIVRVNKAMAKQLGVTPEEAIGLKCYEHVHGTNFPPAFCPHAQSLQDGKEHVADVFEPRLGGDFIVTATPLRNEAGEIVGSVHVAKNITERKKAEEMLRESESLKVTSQYARSLIEASLDPLVTISTEGKITDVNKATEEVTGLSREELIGSDFSTYFTEPQKAKMGYKRVFTDGFARDYPLAIRHVSGRITEVLYHATVYRNEAGEVQGVFAAARDITERKRAEEALRQAHDELEQIVKERTRDLQTEIEERKVTEEELRVTTEELQELTAELQRSNKELEQFAYIASHDLQEPLRTVTSAIGLFEKGYKDKLGEDADMFITYAVDGAKQMQQLIKDLLAYSRVTSRGEKFKSVHCEGVVQHAIDNLQIAIEESGVKIKLPDEPLPMVMGDKTQLIQLFQNLIGNAIKFRGEKPPEVQIDAELDGGGNVWQFSVRDNGIGMDMQYGEKIFTIFERLHTTEQYPGTGLGLALCKKIVERHNGKIWVESKLGKGSTFYFTLPFYVE
ncbi:MAG TPA: MEDS domain-containing protein [Candidatus Acidoferrum sp.]|nr:MEDS domain-containing protein [Candidatus Acidoferrum sp.]